MFTKAGNTEYRDITHGFFGRKGGVSAGIYDSLNCGFGTQDDSGNTAKNRALTCEALGVKPESLLNLYQIHSNKCVAVREPWTPEHRPEADAMVTDVPGLALGILTADCAPVLFYSRKRDGSPVIGAAHAGWGGALKGVLENTVAAMLALGADEHELRAVVGPCIGQQSYEVSESFRASFLSENENSEKHFMNGDRAAHFMFDLPGYIEGRLGPIVPFTHNLAPDTYANEEDYFSYRRSVHRGEPDYGRQLSVISILEE